MPSTTDVLVAGAGPTGLTIGAELARRGISCRLVDELTEPPAQADKAIGIHCRTMEIWDDLGIVREAMDAGIWLHGQMVLVNGRETHRINWDLPELPYAHLGLPQYETERILTEHVAALGVAPERGTRLDGFTQDNNGVTANLVGPDGAAETVRARFLVGCDGAHSIVRNILGLQFEGGLGRFPQLFMLGDVEVDWSLPPGYLLRFLKVKDGQMENMLICVPLRGRGRYRTATLAPPRLLASAPAEVPAGFMQEYEPPTLADIQVVLDEMAPPGTVARNLRWSSIFRINHGIVDRYRVGRVFVAGDAAHLHPPAGGQGMNTGIQDAYNLGWKLALAVRGLDAPGLLDSYQEERRPAGKEIVGRAVRVAFTDEIDEDDEKQQFLREMQMLLSYQGSSLVGEALATPDGLEKGPQPGDRAPDAAGLIRYGVGHPLRLADLTRGCAHTLLLYVDSTVSDEEILGFEKLAGALRDRAAGLLNVYLMVSPDADPPSVLDPPTVVDGAGDFRASYGVTGSSAYLVRPDGHIGFRAHPVDAAALNQHFARIFAG